MSLKRFLRLPASLPSAVFERIFEDTVARARCAQDLVAAKIAMRFGDAALLPAPTQPATTGAGQQGTTGTPAFLLRVPRNFRQLFAFGGELCRCHRQHLTWARLLQHAGIDSQAWLQEILAPEDAGPCGRACTSSRHQSYSAVRTLNERAVERLVALAHKIIGVRDAQDLQEKQQQHRQ